MIDKYTPILPIGMLENIRIVGNKNVFILPQLWSISEYRDFYCEHEWNTVVIDNGVYEGLMTPFENLVNIADDLHAKQTYISADEDIGSGYNTAHMIIDQIDEHGIDGSNWNLMPVIHGSIREMEYMIDLLGDKVHQWSIPIYLTRMGYDRSTIVKYLGIQDDYVHALGLDNILEIINFDDGIIDTFDTSMPATGAIHGLRLSSIYLIERGGKDDYARVNLNETSFSGIEHNLCIENIVAINKMANMS